MEFYSVYIPLVALSCDWYRHSFSCQVPDLLSNDIYESCCEYIRLYLCRISKTIPSRLHRQMPRRGRPVTEEDTSHTLEVCPLRVTPPSLPEAVSSSPASFSLPLPLSLSSKVQTLTVVSLCVASATACSVVWCSVCFPLQYPLSSRLHLHTLRLKLERDHQHPQIQHT